ncbi:MAG TPA: catecholate siderophore receptor Fiu [Steroidobacteraceae bacterium]|nr:catecholate siderophore receptor Fiu [Steroidobacteraceae bacterium]
MSHIKARKYAPHYQRAPAMAVPAALAAGLTLALPAMAAGEEVTQGPTTLEKVEVQDSVDSYAASPKFTQPLQDTPQTIQVIPQELFDQQGATTLTEALRNSAGVGTFYAGENGSTSTGDAIYMRGFDTSNSIFVDGIRDLGSISRDVFNIESIEVEKGPAGTDNGRTAPTGAINIVTRQPFLQDVSSGSLSGGVDGQKRATADWNQKLDGLPGAALRLNVMWQDSDVPGRDHVNNKRWGFAPSAAVGLDGATRAYVDLLYIDQNNIPDGFVPTIGLPRWTPQPGLEQLAGHPVDPANFYGTRADHDDATAKMATLRVEHDFSTSLKLTNTARWGLTKEDYLLTSFTVTGGTTANPMGGNVKWTDINDLSTYTLNRSNNNFKDQDNKILTDQLNLRIDFTTGAVQHYVSAGAELTREEQVARNITATGTRPPANLYNPDWNDSGTFAYARNGSGSDGRTDTGAAYAFDTVKFGEQFLVTAGLRADHYSTDYFSTGICNNGTGNGAIACGTRPVGSIVTTNDLQARDTLLNWKLGTVYKPIEALSLYVDYALSQQPPGGANFQLSTAANNANNPDLDPQKAKTLELGSKWNALDGRLAVDLALFQTTVTNEIVPDPVTPNVYDQTGRKRVKGVELSATGSLTENWSVSTGYSHQDARVLDGPNVAQDGTPNLSYTPGDSLTTWTSYRLPIGLVLGGGLRFVDGLHRGTDGAVGTPSSTGGYGVFDAMASYEAGKSLSLRLNAYNVMDKQYVAAINKSGYRYTPGMPRTLLFSVDLKF